MDGLHSQPRTAADEFRLALQQGASPRIEDFLSGSAASPETLFLRLLGLDVEHRRTQGQVPSAGDYLPRFPQFQQLIERHFASTESNSVMSSSTVVQYESQQQHPESNSDDLDLQINPLAGFASPTPSIREMLGLSQVASEAYRRDQRIDAICDAFEREWDAGRRPEIFTFLQHAPAADQPALFRELVAIDWEFRQRNQEQPAIREYVARYPAFADALTQSHVPQSSSAAPGSKSAPPAAGSTAAPGSDSTITTSSGRYRLEALVGRGGFAEVWRAIDTLLNRPVAVKRPRPDLPEKQLAFASFLNEARRVAGLEFPGVVPVYDVCDEAGRYCIVSQFIDGEPLEARMKRGPVPVEEAVEIVAQVAETLHRAHLHDVVHRDIKPGNILLNKSGKPFVADFGLAVSEVEQLSERKALLGTCLYMSPEQARGDCHRLDGRSDTYSLGVVLYQLLTGNLPFMAKTQSEYIDQILHRDPRPPRARVETVPRELERICLKCMEKQPSQRFSTASDLAAELRRWQVSVNASRISALESISTNVVPPPRRKSVLVALAILGPLLILLAVGFVLIRPNPPPDPRPGLELPDSPGKKLWRDRFGRLPIEYVLPGEPADGTADFHDGLGAYEISSLSPRILSVGPANAEENTLEITISQPIWQGESGIFLGYHEVETNGTNLPAFEAIWAQANRTDGKFEFSINRASCYVAPKAHGWKSSTKRGHQVVDWPKPGEKCLLQVQYTADKIVAVYWNRRRLDELCDNFSNRKLAAGDLRGDWGIWQLGSTTRFFNPNIKPPSK